MVVNRLVCVQICSQESAMSKNKSAACFNQRLGAPLVKGLFPYSIRPWSCFQSWGGRYISWYIPFHKGPNFRTACRQETKIQPGSWLEPLCFSLGGTDLSHPKVESHVIVLMGLWGIKQWNNTIVDVPFLESVNGYLLACSFLVGDLSTLESPPFERGNNCGDLDRSQIKAQPPTLTAKWPLTDSGASEFVQREQSWYPFFFGWNPVVGLL